MGLWDSLTRFVPFTGDRKLAGKDLLGNRYYEYPSPTGGRMRRVVKYRFMSKMSDYTSGQHRLPIQWTAWLSHTRATPPTLSELQKDAARQSTLLPRIAEIEQREREERFRQGYIDSPESSNQIHSGLNFGAIGSASRIRSAPSFAPAPSASQTPAASLPLPSSSPSPTTQTSSEPTSSPDAAEYSVPTPTSSGVSPPPETVDPASHASQADLRKLAEEDTKRRMEQAGQEVKTSDKGVQGVNVGSGGLKPRRRGGS